MSPSPRQVCLKVTPLSQCTYLVGSTNARICPWTNSKWRPVHLKHEWFLIPNLIRTYLCGAKNGKEICYRILNYRETVVKVLKVTITWIICVWRPIKTASMKYCKLVSVKLCRFFCFAHNHFENVRCFDANHGLWGLSRLLETKW